MALVATQVISGSSAICGWAPTASRSARARRAAAPIKPPSISSAPLLRHRQRHPAWGAKKLLAIPGKRQSPWPWPARSTVCDILRRHGLVPKPRDRRHIGHPGNPTTLIAAPQDGWTADFKGPCKTGDGLYGYPLTVDHGFSRFLLGCQALAST